MHSAERVDFMSGELQTRDKQNQAVDNSEQYAINIIGNRALQSANLVVKESKRAVEKTLGVRSALPRPNSKQNVRPNTPRQTPPVADAPTDRGVHTSTKASKQQEENFKPVSSEAHGKYHSERQDHFSGIADDIPGEPVPIYVEPAHFLSEEKSVAEKAPIPAISKSQRYPAPQKVAHRQNDASSRPPKRNSSQAKAVDSPICRQWTTICI